MSSPSHSPSIQPSQSPSTSLPPSTSTSTHPTIPSASLDPRVHFDKSSSNWVFEDDDGREYEWIESKQAWVPIIDESLWAAQQAAYKVEGVDENSPVASSATKDKKQLKLVRQLQKKSTSQKKRAHEVDPSHSAPQRNTAVYVSRLPLDTTVEELERCFSRAGLVLVDDQNRPKIKLYSDPSTGVFNGSALVVFLKADSVDLAIRLFDDTPLRLGSAPDQDRMQVSRAEFSHKKLTQTESGSQTSEKHEVQQRQKRAKKVEKLKSKLEEWDSDEEPARRAAELTKFARVVVLEHMFTLAELEEDPTLLIDLKEDVREECELLGNVSNVTLYDLEPEGIMTVKFKEPIAAQACIVKMNHRFFGGRQVKASLYDGTRRYRKSHPGAGNHLTSNDGVGEEGGGESEVDEKKRLEAFAKFLEDQ